MPSKLTANQIVEIIKDTHDLCKDCLTFPELRMGAGYGKAETRRIDLWAIKTGPATGNMATSFEVKISRADFKRDLNDPAKHKLARLFSDRFYFVAPEGLIAADEVPDWAGLLEISEWEWGTEFNGKSYRPRVVSEAPILNKHPPSWPFIVSLLRREPIAIDSMEYSQ